MGISTTAMINAGFVLLIFCLAVSPCTPICPDGSPEYVTGDPNYVRNPCARGTGINTESECADAGRDLGKQQFLWAATGRLIELEGRRRLSTTPCADCDCLVTLDSSDRRIVFGNRLSRQPQHAPTFRAVC